jgi:predicted ATPase
MDAVTAWLRHFALLESVTTQPAGKLGHSIFVRTHSVPGDQDLTNVGVGVSQVLPILVMSLLADEGSTLIFEQPEIHLHPRVQSLLADFFISLIATGKQCIVETHSEYLINRVRLRVAEDAASTLRDKLSVYFVEKPGTESVFRRVQINEYGAIPEWPRGFFDEGPSEAERIMSASMARGTRREQAT